MTALSFQHTWAWVLDESPHTHMPKTQTARLVQPGQTSKPYIPSLVDVILYNPQDLGFFETVYNPSGTIKWTLGCTRAMKPGRSLPSIIWRFDPAEFHMVYDPTNPGAVSGAEWKHYHLNSSPDHPDPWREARVQIDVIRRMDVRFYTRKEWIREGFKSLDQFLLVWTQMYDPKWHRARETMSAADWLFESWNRPRRHYDAWVLNYSFVR